MGRRVGHRGARRPQSRGLASYPSEQQSTAQVRKSKVSKPDYELPNENPETPMPTMIASSSPTQNDGGNPQPVVDKVVNINFVVGIPKSTTASGYVSDLNDSVLRLSTHLVTESFPLITIEQNVLLDGIIQTVCPEFVPDSDRCEDISISIGLLLSTDPIPPIYTVDQFESQMIAAILDQKLQDSLDDVNPQSPAWIVTGSDEPHLGPGDDIWHQKRSDGSGGSSTSARVGLLSGILFALLSALAYFMLRGSKKLTYSDTDDEGDRPDLSDGAPSSDSMRAKWPKILATLSPLQGFSFRGQFLSEKAENYDDCSSHAGSSGWSSGTSSIHRTNSGSLDVDDDIDVDGAERKSVRFCESDLVQEQQDIGGNDVSNEEEPARLEASGSSNEWTARGLMGIIGAMSFDNSVASSTKSTNIDSTIDPKRAAELDRMIAMGDWEGVREATARYNVEEVYSGPFERTESDLSTVESILADASQKSETEEGN